MALALEKSALNVLYKILLVKTAMLGMLLTCKFSFSIPLIIQLLEENKVISTMKCQPDWGLIPCVSC